MANGRAMKPPAASFFPASLTLGFLAHDASHPKNAPPPVLRCASAVIEFDDRFIAPPPAITVRRREEDWPPAKHGDEKMAQALGYVTKQENGFEGTLSMLTLKTRIRIVPNATKETERQPDFRVYAGDGGEIGGGWNRVGKASGRPYVSLTLAHPTLIGPRKIYANLGRAAGQDDEAVMAVLWNPAG